MVFKKNNDTCLIWASWFSSRQVKCQFTGMDGQIEVNSQDKTLFFTNNCSGKNSVHVRNKSFYCIYSASKVSWNSLKDFVYSPVHVECLHVEVALHITISYHLPAATNLWHRSYVFRRVCDSVHRGGRGLRSTPPRILCSTPSQTMQTPPRDQGDPPHVHKENQPRLRERTLQVTVNERPVRILLECILV